MNNPWDAVLKSGLVGTASPFPTTSRYYGIATDTLVTSDGRTLAYVGRRFLPDPSQLSLLQVYTVVQGDRPDTIAAKFLGDPEQFWRVCDANNVMDPQELIKVFGRSIRITLPEGIPGISNG